MRTGTDRVLTTHTGSLPRPDAGPAPVVDVVDRQVAAGVDVVSDGEVGKPGYSTYITRRLTGFGEPDPTVAIEAPLQELLDYPTYAADVFGRMPGIGPASPCVGDVAYVGTDDLTVQLRAFRAAVTDRAEVADAFVTAASPGVIALFQPNLHYPDESSYLAALGEAMKAEYDAVVAAGFVLQVDCPDLTLGWNAHDGDPAAYRRRARERLAVLDHALRDIPAERIRLHVCWGNIGHPHTHDVPLVHLLDLLFAARPAGISFEAANPRHEHEWTVFGEVDVPDDVVLIPGMIDSTTHYVEHPELVAQRIRRFTDRVGIDRVLAGTDCGFATFAGIHTVHPEITWAKLAALAEGAALVRA